MPVGYQNQSTVWFLGGKNLKVNGHGTGTLDGNGQTWYNLVKGESNYPRKLYSIRNRITANVCPGRPMGLTIWDAEDSTFTGLTFLQSQMWWVLIYI